MIRARNLQTGMAFALLAVTAAALAGRYARTDARSICDMTPEGSVWLTVVRLTWAEESFHKLRGRYGALAELASLEDGLPTSVLAGRMGSYSIRIELAGAGYILRANPDTPRIRPKLASFYADQTGAITFDTSGRPATADSRRMD